MIELTTQVIVVAIDSSFVQARPFSKEQLDQFCLRALDSFKDNGLRPEHIALRTADVLFGYELSFGLFGGSATFRLTSGHLILVFQNILNRDALKTVAETAARAHSLFNDTDFLEHTLGIVAHTSFRDEQQRKQASGALEDPKRQIEFLGRLAYLRTAEWAETIRFEVDRSIFFPPGLFLSWNSRWRGKVDVDTFNRAARALEAAANRLDFDIAVP
jgi:hypothetical protein